MEFSGLLGDKYYLFMPQRIMGTPDRLPPRVLTVATAKFYLNISEKHYRDVPQHTIFHKISRAFPEAVEVFPLRCDSKCL